MTAGTAPSLSENVTPFETGAHVTALGWLKNTLALGLGDGAVVLVRGAETHRVEAHPNAGLLTGSSDGNRFVTGGDDGRVAATGADGAIETLAESKGAWIDSLAINKDGSVAYGAGKRVIVRDGKREKVLELASAARGIAFAPKGYRLAIAHYNGATLWFPNTEAKPELLEWKGSHLDITWSPDARFIVTSMQENALHGWRLVPDKGNMRMSGYPSKTRSVSWSGDGKWLATSGAEAAILWPFESKEGPMGKQPRECGVRPAKVTRVAFHPNTFVLAVGYEDGCILLIRLADAAELLVRAAHKDSGITVLGWDQAGKRLAFGCEDGQAGVLTLPT
jgi:WD40 repeat protein